MENTNSNGRAQQTSDNRIEEIEKQIRSLSEQLNKNKSQESELTRVNSDNTDKGMCARCGGNKIAECEDGVMKAIRANEFRGSWLVCPNQKEIGPYPGEPQTIVTIPPVRPVLSWFAYAEMLDGQKRE